MTFWEFWGLETPEEVQQHVRESEERMHKALADYKALTGHDWVPERKEGTE